MQTCLSLRLKRHVLGLKWTAGWWKELTICLVSCEILDAAEVLGASRTLKSLTGSRFGRRLVILCGLFGLLLGAIAIGVAIGGIICSSFGFAIAIALADGTGAIDRRPIDTHIDAHGVMDVVVTETETTSMAIADAITVAYSRRRLHACHACSLVDWCWTRQSTRDQNRIAQWTRNAIWS